MAVDYVHLHVHSDFSLLDGAASVKALAAKAEKLGQTALALTDHGNMFGVINFYNACKEKNIKAVAYNAAGMIEVYKKNQNTEETDDD